MKQMTLDSADLKWIIGTLAEQTERFAELQEAGLPHPEPGQVVFYCDITKRSVHLHSVEKAKRTWPGLFFPLEDDRDLWVVLNTPAGSVVTTSFHLVAALSETIDLKGSA